MKFKKLIVSSLALAVSVLSLAGCGNNSADNKNGTEGKSGFKSDSTISVISREDGSGTRGAFIELFGIQEKKDDGTKTDRTTKSAVIANKTGVVITSVSGDTNAIGYISLGSLSDSVKALKVDGVDATSENVKNGSYKVSRPFNIATKKDVSDAAKDFISFILSSDGQKIVSKDYIAAYDDAKPYTKSGAKGKVVVAGSSSVTPVMEKLSEAYKNVNSDVEIEIQMSDSTTGMKNAVGGICDIGMASRELKDDELKELTPTVIALDGIAVVVNNENPLENISSDDVKAVFTGEKTTWSEING